MTTDDASSFPFDPSIKSRDTQRFQSFHEGTERESSGHRMNRETTRLRSGTHGSFLSKRRTACESSLSTYVSSPDQMKELRDGLLSTDKVLLQEILAMLKGNVASGFLFSRYL
jgi:hypothetical protein